MNNHDLKPLHNITEEDAKSLFNFITAIPINSKVKFTALTDGFIVQYSLGFWIMCDSFGLVYRNMPDDRKNYTKKNDFEIIDYIRSMGYDMKPTPVPFVAKTTKIVPLDPNEKIHKQVILISAYDDEGLVGELIARNEKQKLEAWQKMFEEVKKLSERPEVLENLPSVSKFKKWMMEQRILKYKGELSPEQIKELDSINFSWESEKKNKETIELEEEPDTYKHALVPNNPLKGGLGYLSPTRIKFVDRHIRTNILKDNEKEFLKELKEVAKFYRENGYVNFKPLNMELYKWANQIRDSYSKKQLPDFMIYKLNEIGFAWEYEGD